MAKKKAKNEEGNIEEPSSVEDQSEDNKKIENSENTKETTEIKDSNTAEKNSEGDSSDNTQEETTSSEESKTTVQKKGSSNKRIIKLFNRWSFDNLVVDDIGLVDYVNLTPIIVPHSGGKHEHKRFWKTERVSIVERFINKMLAPGLIRRKIKGRHAGLNAGKKQKALKIIENAFTIIEETTGKNPIQVIIDAIINTAPREETTRISLGGISYQTAVDISPQRRVDLAIKLLVQASISSSYNNLTTIDEGIAKELVLAAKKDQNSKAIRRKDEIERIAINAR